MKEISVIKFESFDGRVFDKKEDCLAYEAKLTKENEKKVFLEDKIQKSIKKYDITAQKYASWRESARAKELIQSLWKSPVFFKAKNADAFNEIFSQIDAAVEKEVYMPENKNSYSCNKRFMLQNPYGTEAFTKLTKDLPVVGWVSSEIKTMGDDPYYEWYQTEPTLYLLSETEVVMLLTANIGQSERFVNYLMLFEAYHDLKKA